MAPIVARCSARPISGVGGAGIAARGSADPALGSVAALLSPAGARAAAASASKLGRIVGLEIERRDKQRHQGGKIGRPPVVLQVADQPSL